MRQMSGACLCGHIRYTAEAEPIMTGLCHCIDCQRQSGAAFGVVVAIPKPTLKVDGAIKTYEAKGASGQPTYRHFCPNCGSPIFTEVAVMPDVAFVRCGTLDDSSWVKPTMELWCETAQPWTREATGRKQFDRMPG